MLILMIFVCVRFELAETNLAQRWFCLHVSMFQSLRKL